ncbi:unnamed protein product [Thelazia callipaeda]|uniref:long-chain-fatty-acid--CoA ligase n=1 Tax=Thelazia callipaeda TaxID=103827 RepID=A0A0N5CQH8_THECL|nr:unnamed protein product [Thelazia callipaeda]
MTTKYQTNIPAYSRVLPGPERIHESILISENVYIEELLEYPPNSNVTTLFDLLQHAIRITNNGDFVGEKINGIYKWVSYEQVFKESHKIGSALLQLGIGAGESNRVGLAGNNSTRYIIAQYALINYSIILVPLYHNYNWKILCDIIEDCNLEVIFCDNYERANTFITKVEQGLLKCLKQIIVFEGSKQEIDSKIIQSSSVKVYDWDSMLSLGNTYLKPVTPPSPSSTHKGVQLSHRAVLAAMSGIYMQLKMPPKGIVLDNNDIYFSFLSSAHIYEQLIEVLMIYVGGKIGLFTGDPKNLINDIQILQPTILALVPRVLNRYHDLIMENIQKKNFIKRFIFRIAMQENLLFCYFYFNFNFFFWTELRIIFSKLQQLANGKLKHNTIWDKLVFRKIRASFGGKLRLITTGGAPVADNVMNFTRVVYGCLLLEGYGQTECSAAGALSLPADTASGHVGGPSPWAQIKLVSVEELGYDAKNDVGEVCFRGAGLMTAYFNNPKLTSQAIDDEGWLHTNDIGMWLPNGSLRIIDRKNNLFKLAQADYVSPERIENIYLQHALVKQVSLVKNTIFVYGSAIHAFLVAVVVVDIEKLHNEIQKVNKKIINYNVKSQTSAEEFLENLNVRRYFLALLRNFGCNKGLSSLEQIKNVHLVKDEFTVEDGLLTPTMKIIRKKLEEKFETILNKMYSENIN